MEEPSWLTATHDQYRSARAEFVKSHMARCFGEDEHTEY